MASVSDAIALAKRGIPVFRLRAGSKDGYVDSGWDRGESSTDLFTVYNAFGKGDFNIGCYGGGRFIYIDVDDRPAWDALLLEIGPLPRTFTVETPSGGLHYYFDAQGERYSQADLIPKKVNVRSLGGYVVGPGSTFDGRAYRVIDDSPIAPVPPALVQRLRTRGERHENGPGIASDLDTPAAIERARGRLEWAAQAIEGEGGDNLTFKLACDLLDYGLTADKCLELMQPWDLRNSPPWGDGLKAKVENAWQYRQAAIGRDNPTDGFEVITLPGPFERGIVDFDQTAASEAQIEVREWIAERRLVRKFITGMIAPGGVGKSVLSIQWAAAIALGNGDFCGLSIRERTNVLIINNEDPQQEMNLRANAIFKHFGLPWEEAHKRLSFYSGYGRPVRLAVKDRNGIVGGPYVDELIRVAIRRKIGTIIFDPLVSTSENMDENGNPDMNALQDIYKRIASETGAAVLEIHHSRKPSNASSDGYAGSIEAGRGASAIKDAWRLGLTLFNMSEKDAEKYGILTQHKHRYIRLDETEKFNVGLASPGPQWFRRQTVKLENSAGQCEYMGVLVPEDLKEIVASEVEAVAMVEAAWDALDSGKGISLSALVRALGAAGSPFAGEGEKTLKRKALAAFGAHPKLTVREREAVWTPVGKEGGTLLLKPKS